MALASNHSSAVVCDSEIWEASTSTEQPVRAVKATLDVAGARLVNAASIPLGESFASDVRRISDLLDMGAPCLLLIRLTDEARTLAAEETDRICLVWLPEDMPQAVHVMWKNAVVSLAAIVPTSRVEELFVNGKDDFSYEAVLIAGKRLLHRVGSLGAPKVSAKKIVVRTLDNCLLPCYRLNIPIEAADTPLFVFSHGLNGRLAEYCETGLGPASDVDLQPVIQSLAGNSLQPSIILYDARGHGESTGWEGRGPQQFHWRCLANDMLQVAAAHRGSDATPHILGGCSMGVGTALWAALLSPNSIQGLALLCVPTIWVTRKARRAFLEARAESLRSSDPVKADVLLGAARCDLPSKEELAPLAEIQLPVLMVNARDDPVHPAEAAEALRDALGPSVTLVIVDRAADIGQAFTEALVKWFAALSCSQTSSTSHGRLKRARLG